MILPNEYINNNSDNANGIIYFKDAYILNNKKNKNDKHSHTSTGNKGNNQNKKASTKL